MNGAACIVSYDAASAVLALEEGMISSVQDNVLCVFVYLVPMQDIDKGV